MLVRTAAGVVGSIALVFAGVAPAVAGDKDDKGKDKVEVKICKEVKKDKKDKKDSKDEEFDFTLKTDKTKIKFSLKADECEKFKLKFDDAEFTLREKLDDGWEDPKFKTDGDVEYERINGARIKVEFDDHEKKPYVEVKVKNKEEKKKHHGGDHR
jgi:hypothetical protein